LGADAAAADSDRGVKASCSGGAAASASAGGGEKSVLGVLEKVKTWKAARPKVSDSFTVLILVCHKNSVSMSSRMWDSTLAFILPSWFHATSVMLSTWQDPGPLLDIAI